VRLVPEQLRGEDIRAGRWWWNQVIKNAVCNKGKENTNTTKKIIIVERF
jgi:hypothetical protein